MKLFNCANVCLVFVFLLQLILVNALGGGLFGLGELLEKTKTALVPHKKANGDQHQIPKDGKHGRKDIQLKLLIPDSPKVSPPHISGTEESSAQDKRKQCLLGRLYAGPGMIGINLLTVDGAVAVLDEAKPQTDYTPDMLNKIYASYNVLFRETSLCNPPSVET